MKKLILIAFPIFTGLTTSSIALAQESSATLDETIRFIENKTDNKTYRFTGHVVQYFKINFKQISGCTIETTLESETKGVERTIDYETMRVSLKDLDPLSVKVKSEEIGPDTFFTLYSESSKKFEKKYRVKHPDSPTQSEADFEGTRNINTLSIPSGFDKEIANRLSKALKHAITLCGGKADAF